MAGRIALITGAGRGIGRASALALARLGMQIAATARTEPELERLVKEIGEAGGEAMAIVDDLADRDAPARIVAALKDRWGPVNVLVNNAGIGSSQDPRPLAEFNDDFWDLTFAVNVTAPYLLTKEVLPDMLAAQWGRIINIASINAMVPAMHAAAYVASKHALAGLTKATAKEVAGQGITANAVCPGVTATLMNDKRLEYDRQRTGRTLEELESDASPLGRRLLPEEVAAAVEFLAGDSASAINGQMIRVCGGTVIC